MKVFKKKTFLILGTITILWMFLVFFLSSQDGEQTEKLSLAISEFLSRFGGGGTEEAAAQTHMEIRKLAHIIFGAWSDFLSASVLWNAAGGDALETRYQYVGCVCDCCRIWVFR